VATECSFGTSYFEDTWVLPNPSISGAENGNAWMHMPLFVDNIVYQAFQSTSIDTDLVSSSWEEFDHFSSPVLASKYNPTVGHWPSFRNFLVMLTYFGTSTACRRRSTRRSEDHRILTPFLGFWEYVMGRGCWPMGLPMFRPILYVYIDV
jgi:hypothetical protein